jgi:hypothetical protein
LVYEAEGKPEQPEQDLGNWWEEREARMREWLHRDKVSNYRG